MARRLALIGGNLPWLLVLAWLASVAWFLCDDAFISFRYARNLVEGHGLVFNLGERVEGYSNFLWVLELAALWKLFGLRPENVAPWLSAAYTAGTLAATAWWATRLPDLRRRDLVAWMALGLSCTSATFAVWTFAGGLETRQFTFFVVAAVVCLTVHGGRRRGLLAASLSLAAAAYTRPEGAAGIVDLSAAASGWWRRIRSERADAVSTGPAACAILLFLPVLLYAGALQGVLLFRAAAEEGYTEKLHLEVDRENAAWLLAMPGMPALASISNDLRQRMTRQLVGLRFAEHREAARLKLADWKDYERMKRGVFPEDALTATGALGIQSYFLPDLRVVDGQGLVDKAVARNPVDRPNSERLMAHDRRPPPGYVLEERGVNLMVLPSASTAEEALGRGAYALEVDPDLWMPFDAADRDWVLSSFDRGKLRVREDPGSRWELQVNAITRYEEGVR